MKVKDILFNVPGKRIYCDVVKNYRILKTQTCIDQAKTKGFNQARKQILNSEINLEKVIDVGKVEKEVMDCLECDCIGAMLGVCNEADYKRASKYITQAIVTKINQCGKDQG